MSAPALLGNGTAGKQPSPARDGEPGQAEELAVFDAIYWKGGSRTWDLLLCWRPKNYGFLRWGVGRCKWDAGSERLHCRSDALQDPQMQWDVQQRSCFQKHRVLVLQARGCPEKPGRKAEPKE